MIQKGLYPPPLYTYIVLMKLQLRKNWTFQKVSDCLYPNHVDFRLSTRCH